MAKNYPYRVLVHYICRHSEDTVIHARYKGEADMIVHRCSQMLCPACSEKKAALEVRIKERSRALGLPNLIGTPKQVGWATGVRDRFVRLITRETPEVLALVKGVTESRFWIDNRGKSTSEIVGALKNVLDK